MTRFGMGYDVHRLVEGRKLIIGGVEIPHALGLLGHSDADVLLHAISDALLGAAALGDIGRHFPDTDPRYEGADSMKEFIPQMNENIAQVLGVSLDDVNVKATTEEKLGFTGAEQGISAYAVAGIEKL